MDGSFLHAVRRFGFGRRTTADAPPSDPRQWLAGQLDATDPLVAEPGPTLIRAALAQRQYEAMTKAGAAKAPGLVEINMADMTELLNHAVTTDLDVRERLVWFWANHFTVSARAGGWALGLSGCFIHDAIRPYVTGRFVDMLMAVMIHPAMIWYLDNWGSIGPNSPDGLALHRGLNENLARECLELHTLGAGSGYTQHDVTTFAAMLRPALVPPDPGRPNGLLDLGGFWGLHPALKTLHALYEAGELLPIQCVAGPNRSRSHFEAQDMTEIGAETRMTSGWLNRIAALLPAAPSCDIAFTMANRLPLILHGPAPATPWDPFRKSPLVSAGFYENIAAVHAADTVVGPELVDGLRERHYVDTVMAGLSYDGVSNGFPRAARATARLLAAPDGPKLAELDLDGWDTHADQPSRLPYTLRDLDEGIAELRVGLAGVWDRTTILAVTEFGRTVHVNGDIGTDHGTVTAALVLGGAVSGGRVLADWPGIGHGQLFEDRDLQPTLDIRAVAKGLIGPHQGISAAGLATVFPDSEAVAPSRDLLRI
jgi:uncharacterized protein (DUF1501 family)